MMKLDEIVDINLLCAVTKRQFGRHHVSELHVMVSMRESTVCKKKSVSLSYGRDLSMPLSILINKSRSHDKGRFSIPEDGRIFLITHYIDVYSLESPPAANRPSFCKVIIPCKFGF